MSARVTPMLIFTVSYLTIFIILMGLMPILAPSLLYGGKEYEPSFTVPSFFSKEDIENIKYFENGTLERGTTLTLNFNPDVNYKFYIYWFVIGDNIQFQHITWEWFFFHTAHYMDIIEEDNLALTKDEALSYWDSDYNASIFYPIKCSHIVTKVWFTDTDETRNDLDEAWEEGEINVAMGFGFDDVSTSYSAFNLIGLLLTFQSPQIFGASGILAIALNLIANSPIYLAIAYLIFYFITSIIPFIRGA